MKIVKKFLSALLFLIIIGCNRQDIVVTVEFTEQQEVNTLIYSVPISGTIYLGFSDTLKRSETGKFELKVKISQPSFIIFWSEISPRDRVRLLVEPGNNYCVLIDTLKNVQIAGANEMGQMLYKTLPNPVSVFEMGFMREILPDTMSLISAHEIINDLKQSELSKFKELLNEKKISKSFFNLVQKDRDCYYASVEARFSLIKSFEPVSRGVKIDNELLENLKKIYDQYPPNDESLLFSSFWTEYAKNYIESYKQFIQEDFSLQNFRDLMMSGAIYTHFSNEAEKYLSGKALEFFRARHIHYTCIQPRSSFEKDLILLFKQFEKDYPRSEYSKYLKPYIDKIIKYHQLIEQPFDQAISFMENYETINTLEEAVKPLQGKKIYIDVWATWCAPCISEFAHNEALKKNLAENDIQQLYVSIDRDDDDQKWKNAIKYHHLTGVHIRANEEFAQNLRIRYSKNENDPYVIIPWYILIDENGNIIEERAKRPSQLVAGEKLW